MISRTIVVPVRPGSRNEALRYSLRAWHELGFDDVLVIGGKPSWYRGRHIATDQKVGMANQWRYNFPLAMRAAIENTDQSFWWTADDIFPLRSFKERVFCRMLDLDVYLEAWNKKGVAGYTKTFVTGMTSQRDVMRDLGITTQDNADMHMPHLLEPENLESLMDLLESDYPHHEAGHFRALYGGMFPGHMVRMKDPKVNNHQSLPEELGFVSTSESSWRSRAGVELRKKFDTLSPWEKI